MAITVKVIDDVDEISRRENVCSPEIIAVKDFLQKSSKPAMRFDCGDLKESKSLYKKLRRYFWERRRSCQIMMRGRFVYAVRNGVEV